MSILPFFESMYLIKTSMLNLEILLNRWDLMLNFYCGCDEFDLALSVHSQSTNYYWAFDAIQLKLEAREPLNSIVMPILFTYNYNERYSEFCGKLLMIMFLCWLLFFVKILLGRAGWFCVLNRTVFRIIFPGRTLFLSFYHYSI